MPNSVFRCETARESGWLGVKKKKAEGQCEAFVNSRGIRLIERARSGGAFSTTKLIPAGSLMYPIALMILQTH